MSYKDLEKENKKLKKEIEQLKDENASLWFLLDELEKSNISNPNYRENFEKVFKELRTVSLMSVTKEVEA